MSNPISSLDVRSLRKSFGTFEALKGIDLTVSHSELVFVLGPSGSGKSTMLRCCNRLEEPDSGDILLEGDPVTGRSVNLNAIRQRIGMVFQSFNLYPHLSALKNVTLALRRVRDMSRTPTGWMRWRRSGWPTRRAITPRNCRGVNSSASQLPARWHSNPR